MIEWPAATSAEAGAGNVQNRNIVSKRPLADRGVEIILGYMAWDNGMV